MKLRFNVVQLGMMNFSAKWIDMEKHPLLDQKVEQTFSNLMPNSKINMQEGLPMAYLDLSKLELDELYKCACIQYGAAMNHCSVNPDDQTMAGTALNLNDLCQELYRIGALGK